MSQEMRLLLWLVVSANHGAGAARPFYLLDPGNFSEFYDEDLPWAVEHVPFFEASERAFTEAFAFRWRLYKRHTVATSGTWNGHPAPSYVVTEFDPTVKVGQGGAFNTISCAAMHHISEGRWLRDRQIVRDYGSFWMRGGGQPRGYSFPAAHSLVELARTHGTLDLALSLLPELEANFEQWRHGNFVPERGLFYQTDTADGGEDSISGSGLRPSINFAMLGEMRALALLFNHTGNRTMADRFAAEAKELQSQIVRQLWSADMRFFGVITWPYPPNCTSRKLSWRSGALGRPLSRCPGAPRWKNGSMPHVRELFALSTPYYFRGLADVKGDFGVMWTQLTDGQGFSAPFGPRTAERRSALYNFSCDHACLWNAPSWPFETSRVATALANYLTEPQSAPRTIGHAGYYSLMANYTRSIVNSTATHPVDVYGRPVPAHPWTGEDIHPDTGRWLARDYLYAHDDKKKNRGWMYNHATYCDNIIHGLVGIRSSLDTDVVTVQPLVPEGALSWFALDALSYHAVHLTVFWDAEGSRYGKGAGLHVWVDGQPRAHRPDLGLLEVALV